LGSFTGQVSAIKKLLPYKRFKEVVLSHGLVTEMSVLDVKNLATHQWLNQHNRRVNKKKYKTTNFQNPNNFKILILKIQNFRLLALKLDSIEILTFSVKILTFQPSLVDKFLENVGKILTFYFKISKISFTGIKKKVFVKFKGVIHSPEVSYTYSSRTCRPCRVDTSPT
jgi:hypothetical protein